MLFHISHPESTLLQSSYVIETSHVLLRNKSMRGFRVDMALIYLKPITL